MEDDFNFDDEYIDEDERQERFDKYNAAYLATVEHKAKSIKDEDERKEVLEELSTKHNVVRSKDPYLDAEHNLMKARQGIEDRNKSLGSGAQSYLNYVDKRDGPGSGSKLLKRSQANQDDGYLDSLKREGKLND